VYVIFSFASVCEYGCFQCILVYRYCGSQMKSVKLPLSLTMVAQSQLYHQAMLLQRVTSQFSYQTVPLLEILPEVGASFILLGLYLHVVTREHYNTNHYSFCLWAPSFQVEAHWRLFLMRCHYPM
jgi:hypothetical protein